MFNFVIRRKRDEMGSWCIIKTDAVDYYVAWYPDDMQPLSCSLWGRYGF